MAEISKLGFCLPGSLVGRTTRCGTPTCRCHNNPEQRHGPYPSWTRRVGAKTVTRTLSSSQVQHYQSWFDNARRLPELVEELQALSGLRHLRSRRVGKRTRRQASRSRPQDTF